MYIRADWIASFAKLFLYYLCISLFYQYLEPAKGTFSLKCSNKSMKLV